MSDQVPPPAAQEPARTDRPRRVSVRIEEALGAAAMAVICLISFGNVVVRYATNASFAFTEEFSVALLVFMTFVGSSAACATGEHIRIAFFLERMPGPVRWLCEAITVGATTLLFSLVIYYGGLATWDQWYWGETSPGLGYPAWIYTVWLPLLSLAIVLRTLGHAWSTLRGGSRTPPRDEEGRHDA